MGKKTDIARMCTLAKQNKYKKIERLSRHPAYICEKCCRVARNDDNLCKAKKFVESS